MTDTLKKHTLFKPPSGPVVLLILDGVGVGKSDDSNAWHMATTPFLDSLEKTDHYCELKAHGTAVGMPSDSDMGNSEVGHNTLGAGRVFKQGSALVKQAITSKKIFESPTWKSGIKNCITNNSTLHLIGLLSDGNVHNHIDYQIKLIKQACKEKVPRIRMHCLLDGRDVYEKSALNYISALNKIISQYQDQGIDIKIASGGGRMITTMDRYEADWSIVERGYNAHVHGIGNSFECAEDAIQHAYTKLNVNDQYIPPFVIAKDSQPVGRIKSGDTVFLTNFRGDRAIELCQAFENPSFDKFNRGNHPSVYFAGMLQYDGDENIPNHFLVSPPKIEKPLSYFLCNASIHSLAISETQKYGHVTYFWNGNKSGHINKTLETFIEIPSDTLPFDQRPDMKAQEITDTAIHHLQTKQCKFARINLPNGDMVGHTGNIPATIQTMETVDRCTQQLVNAVSALQGITVILADHGNADEMYVVKKNNLKELKTCHSLNPVPFAILDSRPSSNYQLAPIDKPGLANVASTLCNLLGYEAPSFFEPSLLKH